MYIDYIYTYVLEAPVWVAHSCLEDQTMIQQKNRLLWVSMGLLWLLSRKDHSLPPVLKEVTRIHEIFVCLGLSSCPNQVIVITTLSPFLTNFFAGAFLSTFTTNCCGERAEQFQPTSSTSSSSSTSSWNSKNKSSPEILGDGSPWFPASAPVQLCHSRQGPWNPLASLPAMVGCRWRNASLFADPITPNIRQHPLACLDIDKDVINVSYIKCASMCFFTRRKSKEIPQKKGGAEPSIATIWLQVSCFIKWVRDQKCIPAWSCFNILNGVIRNPLGPWSAWILSNSYLLNSISGELPDFIAPIVAHETKCMVIKHEVLQQNSVLKKKRCIHLFKGQISWGAAWKNFTVLFRISFSCHKRVACWQKAMENPPFLDRFEKPSVSTAMLYQRQLIECIHHDWAASIQIHHLRLVEPHLCPFLQGASIPRAARFSAGNTGTYLS